MEQIAGGHQVERENNRNLSDRPSCLGENNQWQEPSSANYQGAMTKAHSLDDISRRAFSTTSASDKMQRGMSDSHLSVLQQVGDHSPHTQKNFADFFKRFDDNFAANKRAVNCISGVSSQEASECGTSVAKQPQGVITKAEDPSTLFDKALFVKHAVKMAMLPKADKPDLEAVVQLNESLNAMYDRMHPINPQENYGERHTILTSHFPDLFEATNPRKRTSQIITRTGGRVASVVSQSTIKNKQLHAKPQAAGKSGGREKSAMWWRGLNLIGSKSRDALTTLAAGVSQACEVATIDQATLDQRLAKLLQSAHTSQPDPQDPLCWATKCLDAIAEEHFDAHGHFFPETLCWLLDKVMLSNQMKNACECSDSSIHSPAACNVWRQFIGRIGDYTPKKGAIQLKKDGDLAKRTKLVSAKLDVIVKLFQHFLGLLACHYPAYLKHVNTERSLQDATNVALQQLCPEHIKAIDGADGNAPRPLDMRSFVSLKSQITVHISDSLGVKLSEVLDVMGNTLKGKLAAAKTCLGDGLSEGALNQNVIHASNMVLADSLEQSEASTERSSHACPDSTEEDAFATPPASEDGDRHELMSQTFFEVPLCENKNNEDHLSSSSGSYHTDHEESMPVFNVPYQLDAGEIQGPKLGLPTALTQTTVTGNVADRIDVNIEPAQVVPTHQVSDPAKLGNVPNDERTSPQQAYAVRLRSLQMNSVKAKAAPLIRGVTTLLRNSLFEDEDVQACLVSDSFNAELIRTTIKDEMVQCLLTSLWQLRNAQNQDEVARAAGLLQNYVNSIEHAWGRSWACWYVDCLTRLWDAIAWFFVGDVPGHHWDGYYGRSYDFIKRCADQWACEHPVSVARRSEQDADASVAQWQQKTCG